MIKLIWWMVIGVVIGLVTSVYWVLGVGHIISKDDIRAWVDFISDYVVENLMSWVDWPDSLIWLYNIVLAMFSILVWPFGCLNTLIVRIPQSVRAFIETR